MITRALKWRFMKRAESIHGWLFYFKLVMCVVHVAKVKKSGFFLNVVPLRNVKEKKAFWTDRQISNNVL